MTTEPKDEPAEVRPAAPGEFEPLTLGPLEVWPPVVLAPMAGVTNHPFRSLCREFGAGLFVSEMITARAYLNGNRRTILLASSRDDEHPRSVQIYGSDPIVVSEMARALVDVGVEHVSIPVLGNGDIWEAPDALAMMRSTGCRGVIVGRGCLGRPWLFGELAEIFDGKTPTPPPNFGEVVKVMVEHARRLIDFFGPDVGMKQMRKWGTWYTIGFPGSARARADFVRVKRLEDLLEILARLPADTPFPEHALRAHRGKGGRTQVVKLPEGYLDDLEDDTPPRSPHAPEELAAFERALQGG